MSWRVLHISRTTSLEVAFPTPNKCPTYCRLVGAAADPDGCWWGGVGACQYPSTPGQAGAGGAVKVAWIINPLLIISVTLHQALPPVPAVAAGPEVVGLKGLEGDGSSSGGLLKPLINMAGGSSCAVAGALGGYVMGRQVVAVYGGAGQSEMAMGQATVAMAGQQGN